MPAEPVRVKPPLPAEMHTAESGSSEPSVITLEALLAAEAAVPASPSPATALIEIGGRRDGPEPTRYGDWEKNGRCIDF